MEECLCVYRSGDAHSVFEEPRDPFPRSHILPDRWSILLSRIQTVTCPEDEGAKCQMTDGWEGYWMAAGDGPRGSSQGGLSQLS